MIQNGPDHDNLSFLSLSPEHVEKIRVVFLRKDIQKNVRKYVCEDLLIYAQQTTQICSNRKKKIETM